MQPNWWRSQLRTWLAEDGTPGEQIDYLLGHAVYGRHPTAAYATAPINEWATALAQRLERYLQASGWEVIAP